MTNQSWTQNWSTEVGCCILCRTALEREKEKRQRETPQILFILWGYATDWNNAVGLHRRLETFEPTKSHLRRCAVPVTLKVFTFARFMRTTIWQLCHQFKSLTLPNESAFEWIVFKDINEYKNNKTNLQVTFKDLQNAWGSVIVLLKCR